MDDLSVIITSASGEELDFSTTATDADKLVTVDRIVTRWGTGHESAQLTLHRDPLKRHDDLSLLQSVQIFSADGDLRFGGRISGLNPESGKTQINCVGHYAIAKDKQGISEIYRDVTLERWGGIPLNRQAVLLANSLMPSDAQNVGGSLKLALAPPPWTTAAYPMCASWYTAPAGVGIGSVSIPFARTTTDWAGGGSYNIYLTLSTDDAQASSDLSSNYGGSTSGTASKTATTTDRRFAEFAAWYAGTNGTADSKERAITARPVVVGTHGLTSITPSTVIRNLIDRYCPGLTYDAESITEHPYEIPQLVFDGKNVSDCWADANGFANWGLNVWDRKVWYGPMPDLDAPSYLLDLDNGDTFDPDGQTIDENRPVNGVEVFYTDSLTDRPERVGPDDDYRLRSDDPEHPCNVEQIDRWGKLDISFPCAQDDAIQIGSVWFAEQQVPSRIGSGGAQGEVKTADGVKVPAGSIRAGDVVRYAHESIGRMVYETTYEPASSKVTLKFDDAPATLSAVLARIGVAIAGIAK